MATTLALAPIPDDEMADFLVRRANAGGKDLPRPIADQIVDLAGPVPRDIQYLAYEVFGAAGATIEDQDVRAGMLLAVDHEADFDAWRFDALSAGQKRVLKQWALTTTSQPYGESFRSAVQLGSPGALRKALEVLEKELGLVAVVDQVYQVTSPFFAEWLRRADA